MQILEKMDQQQIVPYTKPPELPKRKKSGSSIDTNELTDMDRNEPELLNDDILSSDITAPNHPDSNKHGSRNQYPTFEK